MDVDLDAKHVKSIAFLFKGGLVVFSLHHIEKIEETSGDAMPKVVVRRFGAHEIAPQGQEVESASTS
jgi:hypothetical protein